jgi:hypothetical protein
MDGSPEYLVLNPMNTDRKLADYFFERNDVTGYKYYISHIIGSNKYINDQINAFVVRFFLQWRNGKYEFVSI